MDTTKRKPATVGEILTQEFMEPLGVTPFELSRRTGLSVEYINDIRNGRRHIDADVALLLARAFGNSVSFWLATQRRTDLWGS